MLEKIGLPPKPSMRGNNWVVDASHCQGCSSQFTFINRKHHCRRCGGIFCNNCTQQRMLLRGQGDSPVRICEPCKMLEEAARFERYGHRSTAAKGSTKLASKKGDEISQILGNEDKTSASQKTIRSGSCSNIPEVVAQAEGGDISRNLSLDQPTESFTDVGSATPEELREQAVVEKNKHKTLKAEGKPKEALIAFKRGKELERQAASLEISLRKSRKRASSFSNSDDAQQIRDGIKPSSGKNILAGQKSKAKDDVSAELKELGWTDMDEAEKRPASLSLESELSSLLREVTPKPSKEKKAIGSDKSQVIAFKKKALELKRSGNLLEAKEELKRAKILERKIEEEELLGEDDDSDDELSSLIRSMDAEVHDDLSAREKASLNFSFDHFTGIADDLAMDGNFEVTDEDMDDPEMASALKSLGWAEDYHEQATPAKSESLRTEIQSLKREALSQKRAGNTADAMSLLKKAKLLEMELDNSEHGSGLIDLGSEIGQKCPPYAAEEHVLNVPKLAPKSKLAIQRELIALKKKALSLRREGKVDESEEELKKAKVLEQQLEDMNKAPTVAETLKNSHATLVDDDANEEEVTDHDMHNPSYLSLLKSLGWEDEDNAKVPLKEIIPKHTSGSSVSESVSHVETGTSRKSKTEIQRELLALKRKALTLRRQGDADEADEVLKMTKSLEAQLQEYEEPLPVEVPSLYKKENSSCNLVDLIEKPKEMVLEIEKPYINESSTSSPTVSPQQEILVHKRKAVSLKREGRLAEAKEELRQAKLLEKRMEETSQTRANSTDTSVASDASSVDKKEASPVSVSKPLSGRDRFKLQQESLGHKRQALKLRREGRTAEADAEFELAKALESQLQELDYVGSSKSGEQGDDVMVEDFLDPHLLSALQSIGLKDARMKTPVAESPERTISNTDNVDNSSNLEKEQLGEQIKAEKIKAVNLKRSGKQAEAFDALRRAKLYEKKLQSIT